MNRPSDPVWKPYVPPPKNRWEGTWYTIRTRGFGALCAAFGVVVVAVLLLLPDDPSARREDASFEAEAPGGAERSALSVRSRPAGATVFVNGDSVGVTPLRERPLEPGVYALRIAKADYASQHAVVNVQRGQRTLYQAGLQPLAPRADRAASGSGDPKPGEEAAEEKVTLVDSREELERVAPRPSSRRAASPQRASSFPLRAQEAPRRTQRETPEERKARIYGYIQEIVGQETARGQEARPDTADSTRNMRNIGW